MYISKKELLFQLILLVVVFLCYAFDSWDPVFHWHEAAFFGTYVLAAAIIGYWLMPRYLYHKKYWVFFGLVSLIAALLIVLEELVLEQIFFAGSSRASSFPGVFYTLLDILPVITILCGFKFGWDALQKQDQINALKHTVQESELQFLRSQIDPHFLFNNLNNLYAYALEGSYKTPEIILELSGLLRYMLYECKERYVSLVKEVAQLDNFIKLNKLQIENRGIVRFNAPKIGQGYRIAPLLLIGFIENAFKHSQAGQSENIEIDIHIELKEHTLYFSCINSYQPSQGAPNISKGIGLENVKKRLELLYPAKHQLRIIKKTNLYEVQLSIGLEKTIQQWTVSL